MGGAVENAAPARMLEDIRAAGETIPSDCEVFNANVEMDASDLKFEDIIALIDTHYETGLIEFKNGDIVNKPGENEGSAKVLSYAALSEMDKDTAVKVSRSSCRIFNVRPKKNRLLSPSQHSLCFIPVVGTILPRGAERSRW